MNTTGLIKRNEFKTCLNELGELKVNDERCQELMKKHNLDGKGNLTFDDYAQLLTDYYDLKDANIDNYSSQLSNWK